VNNIQASAKIPGHKPALLLSIGYVLFVLFGNKEGWADHYDSLTSLYLTSILPAAIIGFVVVYLVVRLIAIILVWLTE
jgi:hypothetical protein